MASRPIVYAERAACVLIIVVLIAILLPALGRPRSGIRVSCGNNLKQLSLIMKMYANEDPLELLPPLSPVPGQLTWRPEAVYPEYLLTPYLYVCPDGPDWEGFFGDPEENIFNPTTAPQILMDDWSYFYTGYAVLSDEDFEAFANYYRHRADSGQTIDADIPLTRPHTVHRIGADHYTMRECEIDVTYDRLFRLREDVCSELIQGNSATAELPSSPCACGFIPLLIERPGNHDTPGGHVLYLGGHVEFIPYPGKWPMTERTIALLNELDALGAN